MKKRFPALIPFLALLLCVSVRAAGPRLEAHLPESPVEAGEEFAVTVDLTGNPGILHIQFTLAFDRERMECTEVELGEALKADMQTGQEQALSSVNPKGSDGAVLAAISLNPIAKDGPVGIFHFKAKEKLSDFHFSIEKIYLGNDETEKYDVTVTNAPPSGESGASGADSGKTQAAPPNNGGTSVSDTPKSDGATSGTDTSKNDGGTGETAKTNGGTSVSGAPQSNGDANESSDAPKSDDATSTAQASPSGATASPPFTDVAGTWAEDYIRTAAERNLFQGYADGTFRPNNRLTRAQFMMVLWNLAGRPEASKASPFEDMDTQIENFQKAVAWAYSKGFINGTSATTFSPTAPLTRQAAMKILFSYNGGRRGAEVMTASAYDSIFTDSGQISAWAKDAMYWAVYQTILSGSTPSTLNPGGIVTRAQLAAIMVRYTNRFPS